MDKEYLDVGEIVVDGFQVSRNLIKHFGLQQKLSSIKRRLNRVIISIANIDKTSIR